MTTHLIISTANELIRVATDSIVYISSDGNYSTIVQSDGDVRLVTYQLGHIEKLIADQLHEAGNDFIRIGKSLIINRNYIYVINIAKQQLILSNNISSKLSVNASREALKKLKELIQNDVK